MVPSIKFFATGYGAASVLGAVVSFGMGMDGTALLVGAMTAWLGGGALSLLVAYGWWRGYWMQDHEVEPIPTHSGAETDDTSSESEQMEALYRDWDVDLAADQFDADLAEDTAAPSSAALKAG